jgi:hypothetical protein
MHLKVCLKLNKTLKPSLLGKKTQKKTKKTKKNKKKNKKNNWAGFFLFKPGFFPTLIITDPEH